MYSRRQKIASKKSCLRCRSQKRKCDRAFPRCSLCVRLDQNCTYAASVAPLSPSASPDHELGGTSNPAPPDIKAEIIDKISGFLPEDIATRYLSDSHPWLPIIVSTKLCSELPASWADATVDFTLLCFAILLLTTEPESEQNSDDLSPTLRSGYVYSKTWLVLLEADGLNSLDLVKARLFITLFEIVHGLYPAAYISLGAVVRASDALTGYCGYSLPILKSVGDEIKVEESMTQSAIAIIDRYLTMENSKQPSLTRGRSFLDRQSSLNLEGSQGTWVPPNQAFSRFFEASSLLEKAHITLNEPMMQKSYNVEEVIVIIQTLRSFEAVLLQELSVDSKLHSGAYILCQIALLAVFDHGTKADPNDADYKPCPLAARIGVDQVLSDLLIIVQPYLDGKEVTNLKILPPIIAYLVYKSAAILTERLCNGEETVENCKNLKNFRGFLAILGQRWLAGKRYLKLLNEDTTPRVLKEIQ